MYFIVNLETRAVQTYAAGDRIVYGNKESANNAAQYMELATNYPHAVMPVASPWVHLKREIAPQYRKR